MVDSTRLDKIIQFSLAIAALSDDYTQRELGPIHLVKYAYLGDLAYAARHEGETFTGADWRFYHFGPWSGTAFDRIVPALDAIAAVPKRIPSQYSDDYVRYGLPYSEAERIARLLEDELPLAVVGSIGRAVREHGSDTADLLRHVYVTTPMLSARPGDYLDFRTVMIRPEQQEDAEHAPTGAGSSAKDRKRKAVILESARKEMARRLAEARSAQIPPEPAPRYDDVFFAGTAYLDSLAGEPISPSEGQLEFDDSVWLSAQRRDPNLS